jgi:hypothetical protein
MKYEIYHHGILGQKWGVRRYRNEDGSLTEAGKKRYYKELKKEYSKNYDETNPYKHFGTVGKSVEEGLEIYKQANKQKYEKDINELTDLKQKWLSLSDKYVEFTDTDTFYNEVTGPAYDKTYKWYEKNNPEYLKQIITENNGDKFSLDDFHDFRKLYEGFKDELWTKTEHKWKKTPEGQLSTQIDKAYDKYYKKSISFGKEVANELLGSYGKKQLSSIRSYTYEDLLSDEISEALFNKQL